MEQILEELALTILIEGQFDILPIKISHLAKVNKVSYLNDFGREKFANCIAICEFILQSENLDANRSNAEYLATLIMAPKIILKACKVSSAENLHTLTSVPIKKATEIFQTLYNKQTDTPPTDKEKQIMLQFQSFIHHQLEQKPNFN